MSLGEDSGHGPNAVPQVSNGKAVEEDAPPVAALRAAGAILIGKAGMHEIGLGITGLNTIHGTPRNPFDPTHHTGGSSSGVAALVASGICPIALGGYCSGASTISLTSRLSTGAPAGSFNFKI